MVIIVFGLPGSGKSYFASRLARKMEAVYVSSDEVRMGMFPVRSYSEEEKMMVYEAMLGEMEKTIITGKDIVLDATFYREEIRKKFMDLADSYGVKICFISVGADENIIAERVSKKRQSSEADYAVYLKLKQSFEPMSKDHFVLESTQGNIDQMMEKALEYIQKYHEHLSGT